MSAQEYVEGALYRATVDSWSGYTYKDDNEGFWRLIDHPTSYYVPDELVTNIVGPLTILGPDERVVGAGQVVLDLAPIADALVFPGSWVEVVSSLRGTGSDTAAAIARQIEAQTKPPRIPEPGFGAIVEAGIEGREGRFLFVRVIANGVPMWQSQDGRTWVTWASLIDPTLVRDGVKS